MFTVMKVINSSGATLFSQPLRPATTKVLIEKI